MEEQFQSTENNDDIPVLKVSYEQLCKRLETKKKAFVRKDNREVNDTGQYKNLAHDKEDNVRGRQIKLRTAKSSTSRLAANLLKQSLDDKSEGAWQEAWSQWSHHKKSLDKSLADNTKLTQAIAQW